jgi:hypothetical protein
MASVYEKKPFFVLQHRWDTKTVLPKIYKLQSNDPRNKFKAEIHKDDGLLGVEFTLDKMITEFIRALEKLNLDYVTSFAKFGNLLLGRYQTDWKQVLHKHFPEPVDTEVVRPAQDRNLAENFSRAIDLFLTRTLNKKNPGIASTYTWHRVETMASVRSYLQALWTTSIILKKCFVSQSFSPREISPSGRKLNDETLQTLAEYFESIFLAQFGNGLIQRKHDDQLCAAAKRELRRELEERYRHKLKKLVAASRDCYSSSKY